MGGLVANRLARLTHVRRILIFAVVFIHFALAISLKAQSPQISSLSPTTGRAGDQITISGSAFGSVQGTGKVWLGNTYGVVVSWTDTQVVATIASGAQSGTGKVLQGGVWSNAVNLTVITPNISSVTPATGVAGTQVTIAGTGFGAGQGTGKVWLGNTYGVVVSWTDTQVVATIASGAQSGTAKILQGGVWSNAITFMVVTPNISSATPTTGVAGTQVTIAGTGFAASQGSGKVWLGNTYGVVVSWSDTQVVATIASGAQTGTAKVLQGGVWSNAITFTVATPSISSVTPTTGVAGTQVTIAGTGFGASQGTGNVWLGNTYGVVVTWSDTQIVTTIASGAQTGTAKVLQGGVWSNAITFTVVTPNISSVTPTTGVAGTQVTIAGAGFGSVQGSGKVWLGNTYGVVVSWSDAQVVATIASGAQSGTAKVLQGGVWSNAITFTVITPNISSVTPTTGVAGTQITIAGTGFGASQGNGNVWLGNTYGVVVSWSDAQVVATIASGAQTGTAKVLQGGVWSNAITFTVVTPNISSVTPTTGVAGTQVTIAGTGFAASQGSGNVWLGNTYGVVVSWSDTQVVATIASGAQTGTAKILQGGVWSNAVTFTVITPNISSVTPTTGVAGTQVTIAGTGFGASQGSGNVWLGNTYGVVVSWSDTQVVATIASGAQTGTAKVLQGGVWSNAVTFTVITPNISSISPTSGLAGTQVTIVGTGFGAAQGTGKVWLGSTYGTVVSWSDTQVVASVVSGSLTGVAKILQGGVWSNSVNFAVTALSITNVTPAAASVGARVVITGSGFGAGQAGSTVTINGTIATATGWSDTNIAVTVPSGATFGSGVILVTAGGVASNTISFVVTATPTITGVSPASGTSGTQVTVSGSGFGAAQGSGTVLLGTRTGAVVTWSDTQIVANIAPGSLTGTAQVRQNGAVSNSLSLAVSTATITTVSPTTGATGTQVTITGSGFGGTQGSGQVWLGTASGVVTSWSDTQIVATVAASSVSGNAQVLQGGIWSNAVAFTVTSTPQIAYLSPNVGNVGDSIIFQGTGFGASQGSGVVWIGGTSAVVTAWADTQVTATVGTTAVSGVAKIQQNGFWSNGVTFTVPSTVQVTLNPNVVNMQVGDTRPIAALNTSGASVTGLSWTSSNTTIATLSTDDPPIITAVAPGIVTISAGGASADVTVYSGTTLPVGTVLWSNPGNGSGVANFFPAVPSPTGVADVFALQNDGSVMAIASDGTVAWSVTPALTPTNLLPDFQGGAVITSGGRYTSSIYKLDGLTGQPYPAYTTTYNASLPALKKGLGAPAIHTDGTILTEEYASTTRGDNTEAAWVLGIDPTTGTAKFRVPAVNYSDTSFSDPFCQAGSSGTTYSHPELSKLMIAGDGYAYTSYTETHSTSTAKQSAALPFPAASYPFIEFYWGLLGTDISNSNFGAAISDLVNLGQYIGVPYDNTYSFVQMLQNGDQAGAISEFNALGPWPHFCDGTENTVSKLHLLRVGTDGSSSDVVAYQWSSSRSSTFTLTSNSPNQGYTTTETILSSGGLVPPEATAITNADQGALFSWFLLGTRPDPCAVFVATGTQFATTWREGPGGGCVTPAIPAPNEAHLTMMSGGVLSSDVVWNSTVVPGQADEVQPVLQLADGSFVGRVIYADYNATVAMVAFDAAGNVKWTAPGYSPDIATADGSIIADLGGSYDFSGNHYTPGPASTFDASTGLATGQLASFPTQSWVGNEYQGLIAKVASSPTTYAETFSAMLGGNNSPNGTAIQQVQTNRIQGLQKQLPDLSTSPACWQASLLILTPTCGNVNAIELLTSQLTDSIFQNFIQTFAPVKDTPQNQPNGVMYLDNQSNLGAPINVTGPGQVLKITLEGRFSGLLQKPFYVMTERVDTVNHVISVVTLQGHPLAGWRYWRVYSIGTAPSGQNDVVIETGAYDQPGPGIKNYAGYYIAKGDIQLGWAQYVRYFQTQLNAPMGSNLMSTPLGNLITSEKSLLGLVNADEPPTITDGFWDYFGTLTNYILTNVCQATTCN